MPERGAGMVGNDGGPTLQRDGRRLSCKEKREKSEAWADRLSSRRREGDYDDTTLLKT